MGGLGLVSAVELLYGRRFPLKLKGAGYTSYVWPAILYESEACYLKESEIHKGQKDP